MMTPTKSSAEKSKEEAETSAMTEKGQTPEPVEMIVPTEIVVTSVQENIDEEVTVTPEPTEAIVPVKVTAAESAKVEVTDAPVTTGVIVPETTIVPKTKEESKDTISTSTQATGEIRKVNEPLTETSNEPTEKSTPLSVTPQVNKNLPKCALLMRFNYRQPRKAIRQQAHCPLLQVSTKSHYNYKIQITEHCEIPNDESDKTKGDILFLLDSSNSIGPEQFKKAVKLISQTVLNFNNIGPTGIQVIFCL